MDVIEKMMTRVYNYNATKKILSFYECPDECQAYCCKHGEIQIMETAFKRLRAVDKTKALEIEKLPTQVAGNGFGINGYCIHTPCAFLKDNKCITQTRKPWTCAIYPFRVGDEVPDGFIAIQPCKMGFKIIGDWTEFAIMNIRALGLLTIIETSAIENKYKALDMFRRECQEFENRDPVKEIFVPIMQLDAFASYLQKTKGGRLHCNK